MTQLKHSASLNFEQDAEKGERANGIVCTIGPNTQSVEMLKKLIEAGMDIVRLNFSHGSHEFHQMTIDNAKAAREELKTHTAIALDTKGPEIRSGKVKGGGEIEYTAGQKLKVSVNKADYTECTKDLLYCDYEKLPQVTKVGGKVYVDDGLLSLQVDETGADYVMTTVLNTAKISDHKGMNLPEAHVDLPAVSERDARDLLFAARNNLDMVFASFIRSKKDVQDVRTALGEDGKKVLIISKIENHQGMYNFDEILQASDGIMVARGDLGIEIPPEKVFLAQKMMISKCNIAGKPIICATQMLESMTFNPRPTRAEVADVANAVLDGADCVMLSGETAKGKYPIECVKIMAKICREAQHAIHQRTQFEQVRRCQPPNLPTEEVIPESAVNTAYEVNAPGIVVLTNTGSTAHAIAKYKPPCPVYAVTTDDRVARQLSLWRFVYPVMADTTADKQDYDKRVKAGIDRGQAAGILKKGDLIVLVHAYANFVGAANLVRLHVV